MGRGKKKVRKEGRLQGSFTIYFIHTHMYIWSPQGLSTESIKQTIVVRGKEKLYMVL